MIGPTSTKGLTEQTLQYAQEQVDLGTIAPAQVQEMVAGLERAAAYYFLGEDLSRLRPNNEFTDVARNEGLRDAVSSLLTMKRGRPKEWGDFALTWVMAIVWDYFGHKPTTADNPTQGDRPTRFQNFVNGWIRAIDPERRRGPPSRITIQRARDAWRKMQAE